MRGGGSSLAVLRELTCETSPERTVGALYRTRSHEQARNVLAKKNAVFPTAQAHIERPPIACEPRWARAQTFQKIFELGSNRRHIAEGDASRHQAHELAVVDRNEAMNEAHRVRRSTRGNVAAGADRIEGGFDGHLTTSEAGGQGALAGRGPGSDRARFSAATRALCA